MTRNGKRRDKATSGTLAEAAKMACRVEGKAMKRRSKTGGNASKSARHNATTLERRRTPPKAGGRRSATTTLETEIARLTRERDEALEQQAAASQVLQVISSSPGDLEPVFMSILENARRICDVSFGILALFRDGAFQIAALKNPPPAFAALRRREPIFRPEPSNPLARVEASKKLLHIADIAEDEAYRAREPATVLFVESAKVRTLLVVPMLKEAELVGTIGVFRQEKRPFTEKQIGLLSNFAAQAVIAVDNARLLNELRQRTAELSDALEQQTATSDVLKIVSSSRGELQPVFDAMLANATRLCGASCGTMWLQQNQGQMHMAARHGHLPEAFSEKWRVGTLFSPSPSVPTARVFDTQQPVQVHDLKMDRAYSERDPLAVASVDVAGIRSLVAVPMLKDGLTIGAITIYRQEVRPFTEKQIELLRSFAAQAVIAIENARLLNELRQSLEQQTATADVLRVISASPGDLEPVFQAMLDKATHICEAAFGSMLLRDGDAYRRVVLHDAPQSFAEFSKSAPVLKRGTASSVDRAVATRQVVHILDVAAEDANEPIAKFGGARTLLVVPMLKENDSIGVLGIYRHEVRPFTSEQIRLVQNFAAHAVIAIENTRLLNELRESLEQQTATAGVLEVISRSAFDLRAVFETVVESSVKLCGARRALIYRFDGELLRLVTAFNATEEFKEFIERNPIRPSRHTAVGRAALERRMVHIPDVLADPEYSFAGVHLEKIRTVLGVPILKGDDLLGVMVTYHSEVKPFTEKQIALVETFADQAAIAIENVRLLDALRHRTDELGRSVSELRALGEVSQAVNSTLDLGNVLSTIVAKAVELSGTEAGAIYGYDHEAREFRLRATHGMDKDMIDALKQRHINFDEPTIALAFTRREPAQTADLQEEARSELNEVILRSGYRARLVAPLMRGDDVVGILVVRRRLPGQFDENTVELIKTFAAQSALAIQNARLFDSVEARTRELAKSLDDLRTAQDRLVQTEKLASLGQLTAGIAHEIKNPLNFVNNFSAVSVELIDELREALGGVHLDNRQRAEINEIADTLQSNLGKVVQHGKRADAIVRNMLLHSRQGSGDHRPVDINALVDESLNLAYHGARAEKQGFNVTLEKSFDPAAGEVDLFPQDITRVLLNLISNGFYAATKRKTETNEGDYEPTLAAATKNLGDSVEIRIRDNGTGITPEVKEKLFNPFFTTKPAGEGTGLGLSISHDIIVKQHAGSIEVDTRPGEFTEFRIVLPRAAASANKSEGG